MPNAFLKKKRPQDLSTLKPYEEERRIYAVSTGIVIDFGSALTFCILVNSSLKNAGTDSLNISILM